MVTGIARSMQHTDPRKIRVIDGTRTVRWHELWQNNPRFEQPGNRTAKAQNLMNCPGKRPYIVEKQTERWVWREYGPVPGELYFSQFERDYVRALEPEVLIEPNLKRSASPNKQWGFNRWLEFVKLCSARGIALTQFGTWSDVLPGVRPLATPDFRTACAALGKARAYVGHEGGLHHAAAAVGIPAVVIFGGFISPRVTGYEAHANLFDAAGHQLGCGMRTACAHCAQVMACITPERVLNELEKQLETAPRHLAA